MRRSAEFDPSNRGQIYGLLAIWGQKNCVPSLGVRNFFDF